ncbi:C1 family peptidase [Methanobrevibacter sp. YE315]|uniref:C1 family peptidase n=1 Tax=Methanobrevibacter sp. YE315 TaxID=1609968 RepID=UPI00082FBEDF|nr:C1 family peptidase [Methanobrevibacter sp. YE315]
MKKKFIIILFIALMFAIPATFAADNQTMLELNDNDGNLSASYYFNPNAENDNGDGSINNPYKYLTWDRIRDNSILHLKNGEYDLGNRYSNIYNVTFLGQNCDRTIIKNARFTVQSSIVIKDLTLTSSVISNNGDINARNVIFKDSYSTSGGGAISSTNSNSLVKVYNCTFLNNSAKYGGAIYMSKGTLSVSNSIFRDNHAQLFGGAIACENNVDGAIFQSNFLNDYSVSDAGGAIYVSDSLKFIANRVTLTNCSATFGGGIISLSTNLTLKNSTAKNNRAKYDGGAVYLMYRYFTLRDSNFNNNTANNGGALYVDGADIFNIYYNKFINNKAQNTAGAVYCLLSDIFYDSIYDSRLGNSFSNNKAKYQNNAYQTDDVDLSIGSGDYTLLIKKSPSTEYIPIKYDLRDLNQVTSVKNQEKGSNCWAFAAIGSLESCILKAMSKNYDFSENNMINLMSKFSDYGWNMATNDGGYDDMGIGYLTSWLGPVLESQDEYSPINTISPVYNSLNHIQNVLFLKRSDYTDNNDIKLAIRNCGGVATSIYWSGSFIQNQKNYYYDGGNTPNHAVVIVGWDDTYSKSNFKSTPPGDGAWIIKNSWGTSSGENGYYYVSYYDTKLAQVNKSDVTYTFILNDTIKYDKNYQYDIPGRTDFFINSSNVVWYKNRFTATDNEYLTAVSTYFQKATDWIVYIYVNGQKVLTQSGKSPSSYSTIELNKFIQINKGDVFEVVFKITVDNEAGVPISEEVSLNKQLYKEGISYISYDGKTWKDLYDLTWSYSTHTYASQVACIKAFTILNKIVPKITLSVNEGDTPWLISANVKDSYGNPVKTGKVTFTVEDETVTCNVVDGYCELAHIFTTVGEKAITAKFSQSGYTSPTSKIKVNVTQIKDEMFLNIKTNVLDARINVILTRNVDGTAYFIINKHNYQCDVVDGRGVLEMNNCYYGKYNVMAYMNPSEFKCSNVTDSFTIDYLQTYIKASNMKKYYGSSNSYSITLVDKAKKPISNKNVDFTVNGITKRVKTNANGVATVSLANLNLGSYKIDISCPGGGKYLESEASKTINVLSTISPYADQYTYNANYFVYFLNSNGAKLLNKQVTITVSGQIYTYTTDSSVGRASHSIKLDSGTYLFMVTNTVTGEVLEHNVKIVPRISENADLEMYFGSGDSYTVRVMDNLGNTVSNAKVEFHVNGQTYYRYSDSYGYASLKISLNPGKYEISAVYKGFTVSNMVTVNHIIETSDLNVVKGTNATFSIKLVNAKIRGDVLRNKDVTIKFNGNTYVVKTNSNGIATFIVVADDSLIRGYHDIITSFAKDSVTNKIRVI